VLVQEPGELTEGEYPVAIGATVDDGSGRMRRLESDHEIGAVEFTRDERGRSMSI